MEGRTGYRWLCPRPGASHMSMWASISPFANDEIVRIPLDSDSLESQKRLEVAGHLFVFHMESYPTGPQGQLILDTSSSSQLSEAELMGEIAQEAPWWWLICSQGLEEPV